MEQVKYRKVLVPLDGSKLAEAPLGYAAWLAQRSDAELQLIHVYKGTAPGTSRYLERKIRSLNSRSIGDSPPLRIKPILVKGDPAEEILQYSEASKIDLIVMSTHGRTGIKRWLIGSVADRVVRYSNRPVRLAKSFPGKIPVNGYDNIVLALLDGSAFSEEALPYAIYHARLGEGRLILLSVCEPPDIESEVVYHLMPPYDYPPTKPVQWEKYVEQETVKRKRECQLYLKKAAQLTEDYGISVNFEAPVGDPIEEIMRYLENNPVSLVTMTTRGRSGISRWLMGSVAEKVLLAAQSPILLLRPQA